jgi:WD40 repeat protein
VETDHTVKLWSPATGAESRILRGHTEQVNATVFSPDGKILATASSDKTVRLWDPATGELLGVSGHTVAVDALAIRPDGLRLASGSEFVGPFNLDGEYKFWDLKTRSHLSEPSTKHSVSALAYRPDGRILAIAYTGDLRPSLPSISSALMKLA